MTFSFYSKKIILYILEKYVQKQFRILLIFPSFPCITLHDSLLIFHRFCWQWVAPILASRALGCVLVGLRRGIATFIYLLRYVHYITLPCLTFAPHLDCRCRASDCSATHVRSTSMVPYLCFHTVHDHLVLIFQALISFCWCHFSAVIFVYYQANWTWSMHSWLDI